MSERQIADLDRITLVVRRLLDILFLANPIGTSVGVLAGVVFDAVLKLFQPTWQNSRVVDPAQVHVWHLVAAGILIMNVRMATRRRVPTQVDALFVELREAYRMKALTLTDLRMRYRALIDAVIAQVQISDQASVSATELRAAVLKVPIVPMKRFALERIPILAAVLSFLVVGLGQVYNRDFRKGIVMFTCAVVCGIITVALVGVGWPLIMVWSVIDAYNVANGKSAIW